jgi:type VI secretion system secreted protein VgrG
MPFAVPFRPLRSTPRPFVHGSHTATVVGPAGEEISTDKYGRVKVQFHWDRQGKSDADSSCWARVGTPWAGKQWGMIHIPRIGQEVIVDFLEGDPDQPIIVGSVYNADQMPPYKLPDNKTQSGVRSNSTKGGGQNDRNEVRFEDKIGSEQLFLFAQKDKDERVKNDSREWVGNDRHLMVIANQKESVGADKHTHVKGNSMEKVDSALSLTVGGDFNQKNGGDLSIQVGGNQHEKVGQVYASEAGQEIHLKAGMKIIIEAGMQISLVGPGGFVDIGPAGVTIQGTMVLINSGGAAGSGTSASPKDPKAPADPDVADDGSKAGKLN